MINALRQASEIIRIERFSKEGKTCWTRATNRSNSEVPQDHSESVSRRIRFPREVPALRGSRSNQKEHKRNNRTRTTEMRNVRNLRGSIDFISMFSLFCRPCSSMYLRPLRSGSAEFDTVISAAQSAGRKVRRSLFASEQTSGGIRSEMAQGPGFEPDQFTALGSRVFVET